MLERLNQFDWVALEGTETTKVPSWLIDLTSNAKETRVAASSKLSEFLVPLLALEGRYKPYELVRSVDREVIVVTIPFLIEVVCLNTVEDKELILEILHDLVSYSGIENYAPQADLGRFRQLVRRIYDEVKLGLDCYKLLLQSDNERVKQTARDILAILDKYRSEGGIQSISSM